MAWYWWRRRRPWRWRRRRRRRRRRPRFRRRRRAARLARRPRVRRRRWRGGYWRRKTVRRRRRRKRQKKIKLTQWNPATVKKCIIKGYIPLIICGTGTTGTTYKNFASHMNDYTKYDPFGGGMSTMMFTLQGLYEEYEKHHNSWSRSNLDLELCRYKGCKFTLYRHPETDFIFWYNRKLPFNDTQLTGPEMQPGIAMCSRKKKVLIKSYKTKPKGPMTVSVKIPPPTLFSDRWYFQKDLANVPLVTTKAIACSLRFPFCRPQTDNTCVYFQVLDTWYNNCLSIAPTYVDNNWTALKNKLNTQYEATTGTKLPKRGYAGTIFNTFKTEEHLKCPAAKDQKQADPTNASNNCFLKVSSLWGDHVYDKQKLIDAWQKNHDNYWTARNDQTFSESKALSHKTGLYSSIFLSQSRLSPDFPGLYREIIYNPYLDKGTGNRVWIDWCTKNDSQFRDLPGRLPIVDVPLYAAFLGYADYCKKYYHDPGLMKEARIVIQCPYTNPPLYDKDNTDMGFVPYDYNFGDGKMPDGAGYIPIAYRFKWYVCMFHQQNFMNDIVQCGPFAYPGDQKNCVLACKYSFKFLFGGNPIPQQTIKDPKTQPDFPVPGTGQFPSRVQVVNPRHIDEGALFRRWDIRRGWYSNKAIKRMQEKQRDADFITEPPKKPRFEVPAAQQEEDSPSQERRLELWYGSTTETETEAEAQEEQTQTVQQQLNQQLREQRKLGKAINNIFKQLIKTQQHLHAPIIH
nr:MAG: ORF1 [Torque teno virus]